MVDSRLYRFPFLIQTQRELPDGFGIGNHLFDAALFLPADDPDWQGRITYPPHLLVLRSDRLSIHPHRSAGRVCATYSLRDILWLESAHFLLLGWLHVEGSDSSETLFFNTRVSAPIQAFLKAFRRQWLQPRSVSNTTAKIAGDPVPFKFHTALREELDKCEEVVALTYCASRCTSKGFWLFRSCNWNGSNLVAATSRRMMWITDHYHAARQDYGWICRSASLERMEHVDINRSTAPSELIVHFRGGKHWRIAVTKTAALPSLDFVRQMEGLLKCAR